VARDPYTVLGVSKKATEADVKKAFRNLAKKHHPDTHANDPKALKAFQEISGAYDILGDKEKRAQYDRGEIDEAGQPRGFNPGAQGFNPADFEQAFRQGGFRGRQGAGGNTQDYQFNFGGGGAEDIFADILGGLGGGRRGRAQPAKGEDLQFSTTVTLEEAVQGGTRRVPLSDGRQVEVKIPPGVKEGQQIRLRGQGAPGERGGPPGDVLITVSIAPHALFTRDGRDLRLDLPITLKEAVLGGKIPVPTLSGTVTLTVPPNSNSGAVMRLKGKGLAASGKDAAGDLYVKLVVTLPEKPDAKLEAFAKSWPGDYDPRSKLR
jgi:DnaJ-class molecular chaperone